MTITQDTSAPLFAIVGATGTQGSSLIHALQADSIAYRVRALTRDPTKPAVQALATLGCEVVAADASSSPDLERAFGGAAYVFAMTVMVLRPDASVEEHVESEYQEGKKQVDAAQATGVKTLIWGSLPSVHRISGGKYFAPQWEAKERVTNYANTLTSPTFKLVVVHVGYYITNFLSFAGPRAQADVSYALLSPDNVEDELPIPVIDTAADLGEYVVGALKHGMDVVYAASEYTTLAQRATVLSKLSGKTITTKKVTYSELYEPIKSAGGETRGRMVADMIFSLAEFGYYAGADIAPSNAVLSRPARTFEEAVFAQKERFSKVFQ